MKCPICQESLDSEDSLLKHIELHKSQSILSSPPKENNFPIKENLQEKKLPIITDKIFGKEKLEDLITKKLKTIEDIEELVHRRNFVEQIKKIIVKYPFVYFPYFLEDLFKGKDSKELLEKYFISDYMDLKNIIQNILKLYGDRYRLSHYENAFEMNLKIQTWKDKYEILKNNCIFF